MAGPRLPWQGRTPEARTTRSGLSTQADLLRDDVDLPGLPLPDLDLPSIPWPDLDLPDLTVPGSLPHPGLPRARPRPAGLVAAERLVARALRHTGEEPAG